jgi:glycosyltransferase involved in cell wall biosynthesis
MERHRIGIVIPALNEESTIANVVSRAARYGVPVVVDDGSSDRTAQLAEAAGAAVVRHPQNRGYDEALNSGAARAVSLGCESFITMDADGQHDPATLDSFLTELDRGADVVAGVRDRRARFAETAFAWCTKARWKLNDPLCGMKAYRTDLYLERGVLDTYGSIGTELLLYAARRRKRIAQVPVKTRERAGTPRFGRRLSANARILRACWIGLTRGAGVKAGPEGGASHERGA